MNVKAQKAVFAGSFDPFTCAHAEIVRKSLQVFSEVIVAVADHTGRSRVAPLSARVQIARLSVGGTWGQPPRVCVEPFSGLLTDFMAAAETRFLIRGLRDFMDLRHEQDIAEVYRSQNAKFEQIYFLTDHKFMYISGTIVRELAALGGSLDGYVALEAQELVRKTYGI